MPLEFFIKGSPLRVSLDDWLNTHGVSTEDLVEVEYARALLPPTRSGTFQHDDCVGAVDVFSASHASASPDALSAGHERILSAGFDGSVRVWNMSGQKLATSEGAIAPDEFGNRRLADGRLPPLVAAKFITPTLIVAGGWRSYLRLWKYQEDEDASAGGKAKLIPTLDLHGHKMCVDTIAVHSPSKRILSGSEDGKAMLWSTSAKEAPSADPSLLPSSSSSNNKRRKLDTPSTMTRGPLQTLDAHKSYVKGVTFHPNDATVAYTTSSDSTVKTWDLETARAVQSKAPGGPYTRHRSIYAMKELGLVITGTEDRRILLMDPREDAARQNVGSLYGHQNAILGIDGDPESQYSICTASWDGCVRIWDVRAGQDPVSERRRSTYKIPREGKGSNCDRIPGGQGVRVWSVRWDRHVGIVSGGDDKRVQIDRIGRSE